MADDGYFPSGTSVLRKIHSERSVGLLYGQRALMIGALDARNYIGTSEHTANRHTPFQRLARTAKAFETIFFGTRAEADAVLARVAKLHKRVVGELSEDAGPYPKGTSYSAYEPELMFWTMAVMAESAVYFYERLVGRLDAEELEQFWTDYVRFGELFGMPAETAPPSWVDFHDWFDDRLAGPDMYLTDEARYVGRGVALSIPVPATRRLAMPVHNLMMRGSLPPRVRELYGLNWKLADRLAYETLTRAIRAGRPISPGFLARGTNGDSFEMVAAAERRLTSDGRPPLPEFAPES